MNNVSLYGTQRFVLNNHKDLFLFLQVDKVTKPGLFGKPDGEKKKIERKKKNKTKQKA